MAVKLVATNRRTGTKWWCMHNHPGMWTLKEKNAGSMDTSEAQAIIDDRAVDTLQKYSFSMIEVA